MVLWFFFLRNTFLVRLTPLAYRIREIFPERYLEIEVNIEEPNTNNCSYFMLSMFK